jgi:E3 ubiquitin-protein ligase HECTD1
LELICTREAGSVFEAGGLACVLSFIRDNADIIHKDTLHSAMSVVSRLCTKVEPSDESLASSVECLSALLRHEDSAVADNGALKCFASLADRFIRKNVDPRPLAEHGLTRELLSRLSSAAGPSASSAALNVSSASGGTGVLNTSASAETKTSSASVSTTISLLSTLCRGSSSITHDLLRSELSNAIENALLVSVLKLFFRNNYLFDKKKGKLFHTNFIFRVDHRARDGSSRVHHGWKGWGARVMRHLYDSRENK